MDSFLRLYDAPSGQGLSLSFSEMGGIVDSFRAGPSWSCSKAVHKPVWHIPFLNVRWINSWWWTDEMSEICGVSWQS